MPPVIAFVVLYAAQIAAAITIASAIYQAAEAKKQAKRMEEEMRRAQEAADRLAAQESVFSGGGGDGGGGSIREDSKIMIKSSKAPRNVVFGSDRTSGPMMPFFSYEQSSVLYHRFGVVLAGHECHAIDTVYFGEDALTLDAGGWVVAPAKYTHAGRPLFLIEKHLGTTSQAASPLLTEGAALAGTPTAWDASRRGVGVCYVVIHMEAHYESLYSVGLPNVSAVVRGVKAYDPRTGLTAHTTNPALLARWWLVDSIYSPLTLSDEINLPELIASANVCDESVEFSLGVFGKRYECNGVLNTNGNPLDNLEKIIGAMDGDAVWVSGKWQIVAGYYRTPNLHINESSLGAGAISVSPYTPTAQLINAISGQYKGPGSQYQPAGYGLIAPPAYQVEDGGQLFEKKDDMELVNDPTRCQMIAWQRLSRARQQLAIAIDCNLKAYDTSPLSNVTVSFAEFAYVNKVFEVRRRSYGGSHIEYQLQETGPEIWAWDYTQTQAAVVIPNVNVQVSLQVLPLTNVQITSGSDSLIVQRDGTVVSRMHITWDLSLSYFVKNGGQIEWQYRLADVGSGAGAWLNAVKVAGNAVDLYIEPVLDGAVYDLRGRAISQVGTRGPATSIIQHTVIGKTEPPANVQTFTIDGTILSWLPVADVDLAGYELRFHYGNNGDWGTATPMTSGLVTESPFDMVVRPSGIVTLMIKAIDTTGNYSYIPALIVANLGDAPLANVVETITFDPTFAGTLENCTVSGGDLLAGALDSFYDNPAASFYGAETDPFYLTSAYGAMVYTTQDFYIGSALAGSIATLVIDYAGTSILIEYRLSNPDPLYGPEGDSFYGNPSDEFYPGAGVWMPWPGQITATNDVCQFRITIGSGATQGRINAMSLVIDAPDMIESVNDLTVSSGGTAISYTSNFTAIKNIQATLQANGSGAITVEIDKTSPLAPTAKCFNSSHVAVSGATVDFYLKGY